MAGEVKATADEQESLVDFKFDDDNTFFGIKAPVDETEKVIKEVKSDGGTKSKGESTNIQEQSVDEEEEEDGEEITFFDEDNKKSTTKTKDAGEEEVEEEIKDDKAKVRDKTKPVLKEAPAQRTGPKKEDKKEEVVEDENETPNEEDKDAAFFTTLATEMKEKGIFQNIEIKEGQQITEEEFFELQDKELEARVDETFQAFFEELDEDAKNFLRFKKEGGSTQEFFSTYSSSSLPIDEFNEDDEAQRRIVLTHYLTTVEKLDAEELTDKLTWLKDGGKEKTYATKYFNIIKDSEKKSKEALVKAQADRAKKRQTDAEEFNTALTGVINVTDTVGAFTFTKQDQKELTAYITKPTVKLDKNRYAPNFQVSLAKILRAETIEDKQKLLVLAKLVKDNFDITDLAAATTTKVTTKAKSKLAEAKKQGKHSSSGNITKKQLSDFFE